MYSVVGCESKKEAVNKPIDVDFVNMWNCLAKVDSPYNLIIWNDSTYGILYNNKRWDFFIENKEGFTNLIGDAGHYKDSCAAKKMLKEYLSDKITFKKIP